MNFDTYKLMIEIECHLSLWDTSHSDYANNKTIKNKNRPLKHYTCLSN